MTEKSTVVFLGINDAGMRVYDWLCDHEKTFVQALLTTKEQLVTIEDHQPDYIVSCGFRYIVPEHILNIPKEGSLNLHQSYLPYNRGANPNVWSIVEGTPAGVTLHYMDSGIDTGPIIDRQKVNDCFAYNGKDLYNCLEDAQVAQFKKTWPDILAGNHSTSEQNERKGTYHEIDEFDNLCELDPDEEMTVKEMLDQLRALTFPPYNNAKIDIDGTTYYVEVDIQKE